MFPLTSRILVVDDMLTMRKILTRALNQLGFLNITEAVDGVAGWQAVLTASPPIDVIISDWMMPKSTGMDLLKRVRADRRFKSTPVILLTAESDKAQVIAALSAGATGYVVKPFDVASLREQLEKAAAKAV